MSGFSRSSAAILVVLAMALPAAAVPLTEDRSPAVDGTSGGIASHVVSGEASGAMAFGRGADKASAHTGPSMIYAILCPAMFKDALQPLKDWKTKKGMNAEIFTLEEILAAYSGNPDIPDFAKVHQFLRRLYVNNSELKWVLIVGDGDKDSETFPVPYIYTNAYSDTDTFDPLSISDYVPSDVMYSGLEHDWYYKYPSAAGGDYGQYRNEDWTPEVYVGRWPSKTVDEVTGNVNKVLTYENPPQSLVGSWMKSALFAGASYDIPNDIAADPNSWISGDYSYLHSNGRTPVLDSAALFPSGMDKTFLYDYNQTFGGNYTPANDTLSEASFVADMNSGNSLVNTASHAWISGNGINNYMGNGSEPNDTPAFVNFNSFYFWTDAQSATNGGRLPLMYSSACDVANFTTYTYPYSYIQDNRDHTLEQLLKNSGGGAIGLISTTNGDYWSDIDGNWWLEVNFWKEFFNNSYRPGEALYKDKADYDHYFKTNHKNGDLPKIRQNKAVYILLGDPEVPIWTDEPGNLSVTPPAQLYAAARTVNVTVRDSSTSQPVANALVAFTAPDGTFARGWTDESGVANITVEPLGAGPVNLTVTAHNYFPAESTVNAVLAPADIRVTNPDSSIKSAGAVIRAGETVTVSVQVHNTGGLPANDVLVKFYDGDPSLNSTQVIGNATIASIPVHQSAPATLAWTAIAGIATIWVWADPDDTLNEYDFADNKAWTGVTISSVDLAVSSSDISIVPAVVMDGVTKAPSGSVVTINATVHNLGIGAADGVYVRFYDGDPLANGILIQGDKRIDAIGAGGTGNASVSWNGTSPGPHTLFVMVDPLNVLVEFNETNNIANMTVLLDIPPGFTAGIQPITLDQDHALNNFLDLSAYAFDEDNPVSDLSFRIVSMSDGGANVSVTPEGLLSVHPLSGWYGNSVVTAAVSDGVSEGWTTFNVTVHHVNHAPTVDPIPDANLTVGQYFIYNVSVHDPDVMDTLTYSATSTLIAINATTGRISCMPSPSDVGRHTVEIIVTDPGGLSASTLWNINVVRPNYPPVLQIASDLTLLASEKQPFYFKFNVTDADGDAHTFSTDTPLFTINPSSGEVNFTPSKGTAGTYRFNVTVKDAGGLSDTRQVTLIIRPATVVRPAPAPGLPDWLLPLILIVIIVACVGAVGLMVARRSALKGVDEAEKARYESLYGAGTYDYAKKQRSSSLREFQQKQEGAKQAPEPAAAGPVQTCPRCNATNVQVFPDGGAICNSCGNMFNTK